MTVLQSQDSAAKRARACQAVLVRTSCFGRRQLRKHPGAPSWPGTVNTGWPLAVWLTSSSSTSQCLAMRPSLTR
jgi:hypothetical protein